MEKERDEKTYLELAKSIMDKSSVLAEVRDIASAILTSDDIRDVNDRFTVINALAHRLHSIGGESTSIWLDAHTIWKKERSKEDEDKPIEQELAEIEAITEEDLPVN